MAEAYAYIVETIASLIFCAGADLRHFGEMFWLLGDIVNDRKTRESTLVGKDATRWT